MFESVDGASLAFFRVAFGIVMVWEVCRYFSYGWIEAFYIAPNFHFTYYGFGWVAPWPGAGMYIHFIALGILGAMISAGLFYRVSMALFFVGFTYVFLLDQSWYLNHFYLISLVSFLMIFVPAHRAFSLDARRKGSGGFVPAWALWILRFQIGVVYFYGGIAKLNADWLRGEPMRAWISDFTDPFGAAVTYWGGYFFSYGGLLFDLAVVPLLLWRRTRLPAFLMAVGFHLMNAGLFQIGIFPWLAIAATTLFFDPSWPRRAIAYFRGNTRRAADESGGEAPTENIPLFQSRSAGAAPGAMRRRVVAGFLAVFVAIQILFPFRHFLYPGNSNWTEEGHRFAWHMKLRSVSAEATYFVYDPVSGDSGVVEATDFVNEAQAARMAPYPDMVLQLAHEIAAELRADGYDDIEVRAEVFASLNGREPQRLIDPSVDLGSEPRNLMPAAWILPLEEPLPTRETEENIPASE